MFRLGFYCTEGIKGPTSFLMLGKVQPRRGCHPKSQVRVLVAVVTTIEDGQVEWPFSRVTGGRGRVRKERTRGPDTFATTRRHTS